MKSQISNKTLKECPTHQRRPRSPRAPTPLWVVWHRGACITKVISGRQSNCSFASRVLENMISVAFDGHVDHGMAGPLATAITGIVVGRTPLGRTLETRHKQCRRCDKPHVDRVRDSDKNEGGHLEERACAACPVRRKKVPLGHSDPVRIRRRRSRVTSAWLFRGRSRARGILGMVGADPRSNEQGTAPTTLNSVPFSFKPQTMQDRTIIEYFSTCHRKLKLCNQFGPISETVVQTGCMDVEYNVMLTVPTSR